MYTYSIVFKIPEKIKKQLTVLCFGPSQISWVETERLYYFVRSFGMLTDLDANDLLNQLKTVFFTPLVINIQGVSHKQIKGGGVKSSGIIGISSTYNAELIRLNKLIDQSIRTIRMKKQLEMPFPIILGYYYDNLNFERLCDYLAAHAAFNSLLFEVHDFILLRSWHSSRRIVHEELAHFQAANATTGED